MKVFCLVNKANGLLFIDAISHTKTEKECLAWHRKIAKTKLSHPFYADFVEFGVDKFEALVLESSVEPEQIMSVVQSWITLLGTNVPELGYNVI